MTDFLTPLDEFSDEPELDEVEDLDEDDSSDEDKQSRRKSTNRIKVTPAIVRRVIERHDVLAGTAHEERELLAATLGSRNDTTDLTVATLTAGRNALAPIAELLDIAGSASPFTAMVSALSLERDIARRVWQLLSVLGAAEGALPAKSELAGAKIAEAASNLSDEQAAALAGVKDLLG